MRPQCAPDTASGLRTGLIQRQLAVWFEGQDLRGKYYASEGDRGYICRADKGETPSRIWPRSGAFDHQSRRDLDQRLQDNYDHPQIGSTRLGPRARLDRCADRVGHQPRRAGAQDPPARRGCARDQGGARLENCPVPIAGPRLRDPVPENFVPVRLRRSSPSGRAEAGMIRLTTLALALIAAALVAANAQTAAPPR